MALEHVESDHTIAESLRDVFLDGADALELGDTPDPAGVSDPIKLPDGISRSEVVNRLREFGSALEAAIDNSDDEERVRTELARVFPDYVDVETSGKEALANALIAGNSAKVASVVGAGSSSLKSTAAYGDG